MSQHPVLLCVGRDMVLNRTRRLILQRCFRVRLALTEAEAILLLSAQRFAVVLLCYSLSEGECRALIEVIHRLASPPRILLLGEGSGGLLLGPRDEVFASGGPGDMLKRAAAMAGVAPPAIEECAAEEPAQEAGPRPN